LLIWVFSALAIQHGVQKLVKLLGLHPGHGDLFVDEALFAHIHRDLHGGLAAVRLPMRVCSIQSLPCWMVNSMSCMSL
jgi:hypothetical protein